MKLKAGTMDIECNCPLNFDEKVDCSRDGSGCIPEDYIYLEYDQDSSPVAWRHYQKYYRPETWELLRYNWPLTPSGNELDLLKLKNFPVKDKKTSEQYARLVMLSNDGFKLAGDCDFNFNSVKCEHFKSIIGEDIDLLKKLEDCKKKHKTLLNFSLMPVTGGMNIRKQQIGKDRFDIFIYWLYQFFIGESESILEWRKNNLNKERLKTYLNTFKEDAKMKCEKAIYNYFDKVYFIKDSNFVRRLIASGQQQMTSSHIKTYMDIALEYWDLREKCFNDSAGDKTKA